MNGLGTDLGVDPGTGVVREISTAQVEPGPGFVARLDDLVLWAEPGPHGTQALDATIIALRDIATRHLPGDQAMAQVSTLMTDARLGTLAGLAAVLPTSSGLIALAQGWGAVSGTDDGAATAAAGAVVQLIQLSGDVLVVGRQDVRPYLREAPTTIGLVEGVVPGGAVMLGTRLTITGSATEPSATRSRPSAGAAGDPGSAAGATGWTGGTTGGDARTEEDEEVVHLTGPDAPAGTGEPSRGGGVRIEGILCLRGHLNDPLALHCGSCGISMIQRTSPRVEGIRPPLGILVLDDGATYALKETLVLGTAPELADAVVEGRALGVRLVDPAGGIEALHAEVRLDGWEVLLIDWSTRGTYLLPEEATTWQVAPRGVATTLTTGTRIALGGRTLVFDSQTRRPV